MKRQPFATTHGLRVGEASPARGAMPATGSASREASSASLSGVTVKPAARQASARSGATQIRLIAAASSAGARLDALRPVDTRQGDGEQQERRHTVMSCTLICARS